MINSIQKMTPRKIESIPNYGLEKITSISDLLKYAENKIFFHLDPEDFQARVDAIFSCAIVIIQKTKYENTKQIDNDYDNLEKLRKK